MAESKKKPGVVHEPMRAPFSVPQTVRKALSAVSRARLEIVAVSVLPSAPRVMCRVSRCWPVDGRWACFATMHATRAVLRQMKLA